MSDANQLNALLLEAKKDEEEKDTQSEETEEEEEIIREEVKQETKNVEEEEIQVYNRKDELYNSVQAECILAIRTLMNSKV